MAISLNSQTVYLGAESSSNSSVSSWNFNGGLNWGYLLPFYWIVDMTLSPDETYLVFVNNNGDLVYKMNISSVVLTSYSANLQNTHAVTISPNSSLILALGGGYSTN